ncbi:hypothetical protein [Sphingomonas panacis]|uniref:hypothetical protein n=1 Tax=Sphingomonas panacis TaxID=1560345 RepID=UPI0008412278|nr:hypothetical protein [Sphingomonas panacis]
MANSHILDLDADVVELAPYVPGSPTAAGPLREIAFRTDAWLPEETSRLKTLFAGDQSLDEIALSLGRTRASISTRIYDLGLRRNSKRSWTEWDDALLHSRYSQDPTSRIAAELGRGVSAVYARARLLDLTEPAAPPYDGWEDAQIRTGYETGVPVGQIATLIGRPMTGVIGRASLLGIRHAAQPSGWTAQEMNRALELAETGMRYLAIIEQLVSEGYPRRSKQGLGPRLRQLGYGRGWGRAWTPEEDELLRHAYETSASLTLLRTRLGRSPHSIRWRAEALGLRGTHANRDGFRLGPIWSEADEQILRAGYGKIPSRELARSLGRSPAAMFSRANILGLVHGYIRGFSKDEDIAIRNAWTHGTSLTDVAEALNRDSAVISKHAIRLGYRFSDPNRPARAPRNDRSKRPTITLAELVGLDPEQLGLSRDRTTRAGTKASSSASS